MINNVLHARYPINDIVKALREVKALTLTRQNHPVPL